MGRSKLKERIEGVKHTLNLQLDSVFDTLNEKTMEIERKIEANIAEF